MAARPLPDGALVTITIQSGGTVPSAYANQKVGSLETISFHNAASFPVNIVMTNTLATINGLGIGATSGAQGGSTPLSVTLNYTIWNANTRQQTGGPYSIQFGIGPLPITISADSTSPDPIAIPPGGQVQFTTDDEYSIGWTLANGQPANVWSPQPTQLVEGLNAPPQAALAGGNGQTLTYTISDTSGTQGKGTVKIGT
jgi:hypothetical protein